MQPCPYKNCGARYACSPPASVIGWQTSYMIMLPAGERHWLANKLYDYEEVYEEEEERLTPYTMEELNARIDRSLADAKAGRTYTSDEVRQFMEAKHPWLCE